MIVGIVQRPVGNATPERQSRFPIAGSGGQKPAFQRPRPAFPWNIARHRSRCPHPDGAASISLRDLVPASFPCSVFAGYGATLQVVNSRDFFQLGYCQGTETRSEIKMPLSCKMISA